MKKINEKQKKKNIKNKNKICQSKSRSKIVFTYAKALEKNPPNLSSRHCCANSLNAS